ncbi:shikimate kinase [Anaerophilus nitritogenes]|uniref:shikimate kinase n=1 Tax=Anaerophilus nitritogenes TaxID=2498136 RepID=UPI00101D9C06|nr:shikimate kinase [Anaerophilus nitritogenes]
MIKDKNIVLIGMPGCGKTTIGKLLAEKLDMDFCDLDEYIEKREEKSIPEIFEEGEDTFRKIEASVVKELSQNSDMIISTGGGVVKNPENIENLKTNGIILFINRPIENIVSDIDIYTRPLLQNGKEKIYKLYEERYLLYKKYCDEEMINDEDLQIVVDKIIRLL